MAFPSPRVPLRRAGRLLPRVLIALSLALLLGAPALAANCAYPPTTTEDWHFVDDIARNKRLVHTGPKTYGTFRIVDSETNMSSKPLEDATLSWRGYATTTYSASLRSADGSATERRRESVKVTLDLDPFQEGFMRVREVSQLKYYTFDTACLWFNETDEDYLLVTVETGVKGRVESTWHEHKISVRSVY